MMTKLVLFNFKNENTQANTQGTGKLIFYSFFLSFGTDSKKTTVLYIE